ncbi:hypothetical protein DRE_00916 [Drechslerella stenobrocha 248]|uniref:Uncharacterized protein n=1 Tax=Drechslerella stenobrocha 248 TaxID=1043628 RepID=W7HXL0_9PEZI|nr:hypothetical protein DRE_00916 [Drechslerella stenobrocha 248]
MLFTRQLLHLLVRRQHGRLGGRRRGTGQQPKYPQPNTFGGHGDPDFQPKLPSDTAPAFRFVEKRARKPKPSSGRGHEPPQSLPQPAPQSRNALPPRPPPVRSCENKTTKTIRILQHPSKLVSKQTHEPSINPPRSRIPEAPLDGALVQDAPSSPESTLLLETCRLAQLDRASTPELEDQYQKADEEGLLTMEEAIKKLSVRELLDTSDIIEPLPKPRLQLPCSLVPSTPAVILHDSNMLPSSPLTITQTPLNPHNPANSQNEPTPIDRFLKVSDILTRVLTDRLDNIHYDPELSSRLKPDFEAFDAAFNSLPLDRSLNPYRIIHTSITSLKRCLEQRNHDAKVLGALKQMTQTYDMLRTQALHERWLRGEQPVTAGMRERFQMGCLAVARSGDELIDTLKWNIRGGDMHVNLFTSDGNTSNLIL